MRDPSGPVVCVSYVALAELWTVPRFPRVNYGTAISTTEWSIAADGPMVAAALAGMGAPVRLLANDIGDDEHGRFLRRWLAQRDVIPVTTRPYATTPRIVVAADDAHTRTWFAHLPNVVASLDRIDLTPVTAASFLYVDSYEIIEGAVLRAIAAARRAGIPILLNLGGSSLAEPTAAAIAGYPRLLVQTNVDDSDHLEAVAVATALLERTSGKWAVVTAGAFGAVAVSRSNELAVPSFPVNVRHTHCARAAFSAGLLYGLREGWSMLHSLRLGCASGALRCARHHSAPLPSLTELLAVIDRTEPPASEDS
ncbi:carbohydrate kinase family protein [Nocardia sp. MDA0666]|uniref:carbohydrate kinase family protein n=1 Tax=Nocardia sp. MDA0666 TaxID=2135448 RepID=UPI0018ED71BA|nr:carbohydrate kinase family protein [Nocardia sp. MDA0666]